MEKEVQEAAERLGDCIRQDSAHLSFLEAHSVYGSDQELKELRAQYGELATIIREKQAAGEHFQEEIQAVQEIQQKIGQHPSTQAVLDAQKCLQDLFICCNEKMTEVLGINFADLAAAQQDCGDCGGCSGCGS